MRSWRWVFVWAFIVRSGSVFENPQLERVREFHKTVIPPNRFLIGFRVLFSWSPLVFKSIDFCASSKHFFLLETDQDSSKYTVLSGFKVTKCLAIALGYLFSLPSCAFQIMKYTFIRSAAANASQRVLFFAKLWFDTTEIHFHLVLSW